MRRREDTEDQPPEDWLPWLRRIIRTRGYDIDSLRGGGSTRLAADTGLAPATVSRILDGSVPGYETAVILARTLDIPLPLLLIRTGKATEDDFPQFGSIAGQSGVLSEKPLSPEEVAIAADVPDGDREWFATMVRRMRRENGADDGTAGGAAARG
jgi:transcriptional regulator with XRE-family HTH domain